MMSLETIRELRREEPTNELSGATTGIVDSDIGIGGGDDGFDGTGIGDRGTGDGGGSGTGGTGNSKSSGSVSISSSGKWPKGLPLKMPRLPLSDDDAHNIDRLPTVRQ